MSIKFILHSFWSANKQWFIHTCDRSNKSININSLDADIGQKNK